MGFGSICESVNTMLLRPGGESAAPISALGVNGFALVASVYGPADLDVMRDEATRLSAATGSSCVRHLGPRSPLFRDLAAGTRIAELIGTGFRCVRGILFDKTRSVNWAVSWHQDVTIAVERRDDVPGYGPWSVKDGVVHAQAPTKLLEQMATLRIHLDDTPPENGALRVIPGSHRHGHLGDGEIGCIAGQPEVSCAAKAGDVLLMSPLLLHASRRATHPARRRVVHLEYAPRHALDPGLAWVEVHQHE